jgi:hypothetical protein
VGGGLDSEGWSLFSCVTQNIGEGLWQWGLDNELYGSS